MSSLPAFTFQAEPFGRSRLAEMYESDELFNEGLLSFEYPLFVATDDELEYFFGSLVKKVTHVAEDVGKAATKVAKAAGSVVNTVNKVIPTSIITSTLSHTPIGMAVRAGIGAVSAAASGKNVFQGALRSVASDPAMRFIVDTGMAAARGENILKAAQKAAQAGIGDLRESLRFAAMVAPFVPGIGTGIGAALGAANALASGQPITEAVMAAARGALPGGAIAQTAFDTAVNLAKGKNFAEAALSAARNQLPGGPAAQAAFDAGLALAKGKSIQDAAFAAAGRILPKSPYSADVLSFARKVAAGENIQKAALSAAGNLVMKRIEQQAGPILSQAKSIGGLAKGKSIQQAALAAAGRVLPKSPSVANGLSLARNVAKGESIQKAALSAVRNAAVQRMGKPTGLQREVPEMSGMHLPARSGRWIRQDNKIIVLGYKSGDHDGDLEQQEASNLVTTTSNLATARSRPVIHPPLRPRTSLGHGLLGALAPVILAGALHREPGDASHVHVPDRQEQHDPPPQLTPSAGGEPPPSSKRKSQKGTQREW